MGFLEDIKNRVLIFDGSKGFMLQLAGLPAGDSPESFNLTHPDIIYNLHKAYVDVGCDVIQTNTFTGNRLMLQKHGLGDKTIELNRKGTEIAKKAAGNNVYVAASIGPTGLLFEPFGELTFDTAYDIFKEQVMAVADGGADVINFETFTDVLEMKAALLATKENTNLPVICSMAFEQNKRTLMGTDPASCARILKSTGADMVGANCSFGPGHMIDIITEMAKTGEYLSVKPNAGLPRIEDGITVYDQCAVDFANDMTKYFELNVRLIGGCCGTTPEYIRELLKRKKQKDYSGEIDSKIYLCSQSASIPVGDIVSIDKVNISDGTDKYDVVDEIQELTYSDSDVMELVYSGKDENRLADIITGAPGIGKKPLIISGGNDKAIMNALRIYPGIAGIRKELDSIYGAVVI